MSPLPDEVFEAMSQAHSLPPPPNYQEAMRSEAKLSPLFYRGPTKESVKSAILPAAKDNSGLIDPKPQTSQRGRQATSEVPVTDAELYGCEILTVADEPCGASQDRSVRPLEVKVGQLKRGNDKVC